jgi:hypothetical protein
MQRRTDGSNEATDGERTTRRAVVGAVGVAVGTALAGCSGGGDGSDGGSTPTETGTVVGGPGTTRGAGGSTDRSGSESGSGSGPDGSGATSARGYSGSGCPSPPYEFEYEAVAIPDETDGTKIGETEKPTFADEIADLSTALNFPWVRDGTAMLFLSGTKDTGYDYEIRKHENDGGLTDITDRFEFEAGRARAFGTTGDDLPKERMTHVVVPGSDDAALHVEVGTLMPQCPDALGVIYDRFVESIAPA